jgi:hypothetical protein
MLPITSQTAAELDVLFGLYQLAIEYTKKMERDETHLVKWMDTRQRILGKTACASEKAVHLLKTFRITPNIPANEKALIDEKKNMIKEILPLIQQAEYKIMKKMNLRMKAIRSELAGLGRKQQASAAYLKAPRPAMAMF